MTATEKQPKIEPFNPRQIEAIKLMREPYRHIQLEGGSRAGKTAIIVRQLMERARKIPGSRHGSFRLKSNHAKRSLWLDTIPKVLDLWFIGYRRHLQFRTADQYIIFPNGSEYWIGGLDDKERVDKILGTEFLSLHFNETSQIPYPTVQTVLTRLAQNIPGALARAYYDLNPVGKTHWSHVMFHMLRDPMQPNVSLDPAKYARLLMRPQDNAAHLDPEYIDTLSRMPPRLRARFFLGEYQDEMENALWTMSALSNAHTEVCTRETLPVPMRRIVVGVDPSGASGDSDSTADDIGIVVCGYGIDDTAYVLEDASCNGSPKVWAARVREMREKWNADKVVAERNYGGAMVENVIQNADPNSPVELVTASHGKALRAEPVSVMYEHGRVRHCCMAEDGTSTMEALENEMLSIKSGDTRDEIKARLGHSPDRLDAAVFALIDIFGLHEHGIFEVWKQEIEAARNRPPKPLGVVDEDRNPIPMEHQHAAVKEEFGTPFFDPGDLARAKPEERKKPVCSSCGSTTVREYAEVWQCVACGATGRIH